MPFDVLVFLVPLLFRNNFDLKSRGGSEAFKLSRVAWTSMILWTTTYVTAAILALAHAWRESAGFLAGVGWSLLFVGIWTRRIAYGELDRYYHPSIGVRPDHQVIDTGSYRYLRHPMHLGMLMEITGWCLMSESAWGGLIFGIAFVNTCVRNLLEERELIDSLGEPYARLCRTTWDITRPFGRWPRPPSN